MGEKRFQQKFFALGYYRWCHGIIVVYDITNDHSFRTLFHWDQDIEKNASESVVKILIGNKTDLNDQRVWYPSTFARVQKREFF